MIVWVSVVLRRTVCDDEGLFVMTLGSLSKSLRLALLQLLLLKRSGESTSRQSAKFKFEQRKYKVAGLKS